MTADNIIDPGRRGTDWTVTEVAALVADYFTMFAEEAAGRACNKRERNRALQELTGRSAGSIEFKHQNVSAVLAELGLPWLRGYKPRSNYQDALIAAVERHLGELPTFGAAPKPAVRALDEVFVEAPERQHARANLVLDRLIRKFDPAERDARNRALGLAGEEYVFEVEERRLLAAGRPDLMGKVAWVSRDEGDGAGFDIRSFNAETGGEALIEVKTTRGARTTPFFLSRNEEALSRERPESWRLYRVFEFGGASRIFTLKPPLNGVISLSPATWSASFR